MRFLLLFLLIFGNVAYGHQFTPAYPRLDPSYMDGVLVTRMELFNLRDDVEYYEIAVFDKDWNPVKFATADNILNVKYLQKKVIEIYIREKDRENVTYICSKSKIGIYKLQISIISSRICSKVK